jgi:Ca2+-binding EF-hand superfamily protein
MKVGTSIDTSGDGRNDTVGISLNAAAGVVKKYLDYVEQQETLDKVFAEFDTNGTGALEKHQVFALLHHVRTGTNVTETDLEYVMSLVDRSHTGTLLREEVLPAIAVWKKLVDEHVTPHESAEGRGRATALEVEPVR